ncbi:MAG: SCO family protein [Myxococcales bacterium]|nr:SCO family protein [Myxococcales bacterium]
MGLLRRDRSHGPTRLAVLLACVPGLLVFSTGCGREHGGPGVYAAHGVVEDVDLETAQVLIDHEAVDGLMEAMTMSFVVPDAEVLAALAPGQVIDFEIGFTGRSYEVRGFEVVGEASPEEGWRRLGDGLVRTSEAPPFDLIDQAGRSVSLASLGDRVLLVDFIYTSCPGPCPVQTANQVALQRRLPERLREDVHFVSITLDPEVDEPPALRRYAEARGADLATWSFLTGPPDVVAELVRRWGVGSIRREGGEIDHTLLTFLVHEGRVMERFTPQSEADEIFEAVVALAEARHARVADDTAAAAP